MEKNFAEIWEKKLAEDQKDLLSFLLKRVIAFHKITKTLHSKNWRLLQIIHFTNNFVFGDNSDKYLFKP